MTALHGTHAEYDMMQCQRLHYITQNQFALCTCTAFVAIHDSTLAKQQIGDGRHGAQSPPQHNMLVPSSQRSTGNPGPAVEKGQGSHAAFRRGGHMCLRRRRLAGSPGGTTERCRTPSAPAPFLPSWPLPLSYLSMPGRPQEVCLPMRTAGENGILPPPKETEQSRGATATLTVTPEGQPTGSGKLSPAPREAPKGRKRGASGGFKSGCKAVTGRWKNGWEASSGGYKPVAEAVGRADRQPKDRGGGDPPPPSSTSLPAPAGLGLGLELVIEVRRR
eukprot:CAMPEP_0174317304 /NCGR_PEP_ID=MMETSP0810-20121108/7504_1 /TAXON_ID=73025 ORGANISM="Eutreptiella gymnastica-like, Strain CCMP1594" /NCGR_SAMPLE_ID=MMETSP0810 /ASSEMBLY_ACC=CAM_ASM_000659 /LENGTH=275 /DNA_ID=CAMNT_0015427259 /DNA_START=719 /DNA_END=1547 /DNA_ORIENTATION=+